MPIHEGYVLPLPQTTSKVWILNRTENFFLCSKITFESVPRVRIVLFIRKFNTSVIDR